MPQKKNSTNGIPNLSSTVLSAGKETFKLANFLINIFLKISLSYFSDEFINIILIRFPEIGLNTNLIFQRRGGKKLNKINKELDSH